MDGIWMQGLNLTNVEDCMKRPLSTNMPYYHCGERWEGGERISEFEVLQMRVWRRYVSRWLRWSAKLLKPVCEARVSGRISSWVWSSWNDERNLEPGAEIPCLPFACLWSFPDSLCSRNPERAGARLPQCLYRCSACNKSTVSSCRMKAYLSHQGFLFSFEPLHAFVCIVGMKWTFVDCITYDKGKIFLQNKTNALVLALRVLLTML